MQDAARRIRRTARIVLLDPADRVLLFRYVPPDMPPFWIMPGGECDPGEDFAAAAHRELLEETGIDAQPAPLDLMREAQYDYMGEPVHAIEHFFRHSAADTRIDTAGHTPLEQEVMQEYLWLTRDEIAGWHETVYPENLVELLDDLVHDSQGAAPA